MPVTDVTDSRAGTTFQTGHKTVVVHDGRRGPVGLTGDTGATGDQGDSVNILGTWVLGTTYGPNDAVSWRSSLVQGVNSLFVQKQSAASSPSTVEPHLDAARWDEIGAVDWGNAYGGIWELYQAGHEFTMVGEPVGYSFQSDSYVLADARWLDEVGIAVVREVVDVDRVILQSSGEVPSIDPAVIYPAGSAWEPGRIYYVSSRRGRLETTPPVDPNYFTSAVLLPSDPDGSGGRNGIALPWTPSGGPGSQAYVPVGWNKFYFTATAGQTTFTGVDDQGNTLAYEISDLTDVFLDGLNLVSGSDFTATDGTDIVLTAPALLGQVVEIWTPDQPRDLLVPSTVVKLDNIEGLFNGTTTTFPLEVSGIPVVTASATNFMVWLDANPNEPEVDYIVLNDQAFSEIQFTEAPVVGTRFWGMVWEPTIASPSATDMLARIVVLEAQVAGLLAP